MAKGDGQTSVRHAETVVCRTRPITCSLFTALRSFSGPKFAWFAPNEPSFVSGGIVLSLSASGPERFRKIRRKAECLYSKIDFGGIPDETSNNTNVHGGRPRLVGGFSYHNEHPLSDPWKGFKSAEFFLPQIQVTSTQNETWLTISELKASQNPKLIEARLDQAETKLAAQSTQTRKPPGIKNLNRSPSRQKWRRQVSGVVSRIQAGELTKIVLAQTISGNFKGSFNTTDTLYRLKAAYPDCYVFAINPSDDTCFFGATPEQLIHQNGLRIETDALAGSIGRGRSSAEDARLEQDLVESPKAQHEQALVVDAVRRQLEGVTDTVSVGEQSVRKLKNVQHLDTEIRALLDEPTPILRLVEHLHPTPAVGGLPPETAKRTIKETEQFDRGWYASPLGWFDANQNGTFSVAIRSAISSHGTVTLYAGNGIVASSDPDEEWDELQLKYQPILSQLRRRDDRT